MVDPRLGHQPAIAFNARAARCSFANAVRVEALRRHAISGERARELNSRHCVAARVFAIPTDAPRMSRKRLDVQAGRLADVRIHVSARGAPALAIAVTRAMAAGQTVCSLRPALKRVASRKAAHGALKASGQTVGSILSVPWELRPRLVYNKIARDFWGGYFGSLRQRSRNSITARTAGARRTSRCTTRHTSRPTCPAFAS